MLLIRLLCRLSLVIMLRHFIVNKLRFLDFVLRVLICSAFCQLVFDNLC
jgi:hypothetical protein